MIIGNNKSESCVKFGIGYAPARWDALLDRYGTTEDERQILLRAGLIIERQPGSGSYQQQRSR